jgi:cytochrome P450
MMKDQRLTASPAPAPAGAEDLDELLTTFDLFSPEHWNRSDDVLRYARERCPVPYTTVRGGQHMVTRYADVRQVLENPQLYSSDANMVGGAGLMMPPIDLDPPRHHAFRAILNPYFHPKYIAAREPVVRDIAVRALSPWIESGECEFISQYAGPFITDVLAAVVFDEPDKEVFRLAAEHNERIATGDASAFVDQKELLTRFVERRRAEAGSDDLVSAIDGAVINGVPLTEVEKVGAVTILFAGGLDTTKIAISNIVHRLALDPGLEAQLRQPEWERHILDEFLRLDSPVSALARVATCDTELAGQSIREGDQLAIYYGSANRDQAAFADPESLVLDRKGNPHVAFGMGIHRCLGMHLARLQIKVAINEFLERATNIRLQPGAVPRRRPGVAPIFETLPVEFDLVRA